MSLRDHYLRTTYRVSAVAPPIDIRIGELCPRLDALLEKHGAGEAGDHPSTFILHPCPARTWAFITAWNPGSKPTDDATNRRRQAELEAEVKQGGYAFYRGAGIPDDLIERSSGSSFHVPRSSFGQAEPAAPGWKAEDSILIVGLDRDDAIAIGKKYGQAGIVIGTRGGEAELLFM